ncbi:hypothetical protein GGR32_000739 [Mesonia hippocampi]|uniref:DUF4838 domain-containing protein n=1 Tax=Mesonia hippocampi TaxID=1628250 RepID=A0A840EMY4_9FLAO|nr:DUF4838 domain-containing protein [Mesonia hippocampi]MBB4118465.1 hypothetical protein [Mesonia hippocampi]
MWRFNYFFIFLLFPIFCFSQSTYSLKSDVYLITSANDSKSKEWANYTYNQFEQQSLEKNIIYSTSVENASYKDAKKNNGIYLVLDPNLAYDYCIEKTSTKISLKVKNEKTSKWIINQLLAVLSKTDHRFSSHNLLPAIIDFKTDCINFDFSYREPHFYYNLQKNNAAILNTNNVETDWGLWGHNLHKIITKKPPTLYAEVNHKRLPQQFCFSSVSLYQQTLNYIVNNYGNGKKVTYRFMIMPNDNKLVCTCKHCLSLGNTTSNATPAVTYFIKKLAERFPNHHFFTSAYLTTKTPPKEKLTKNIGVMISTIELPKGIALNEQQTPSRNFIKQVNAWKEKTENIYLWDYAANFDDYLTPIPVLYALQEQLRFFKKFAIKGVFLNANGYDYASFDDLKTFISAALMLNTEVNIDNLIKAFFQKEYPENHALLTNYYLSLEKNFKAKRKKYPLYGGIREILNTYLDATAFTQFYKDLEKIIPKTTGNEKEKLKKLFTALSYTRLQIGYALEDKPLGFLIKNNTQTTIKPRTKQWLASLKAYKNYPELKNYKEADGALPVYCEAWETNLLNTPYKNFLINTKIELLSEADESFKTTRLLNNGILGFASDYHQGWYINSIGNMVLKFTTLTLQQAKTIKLRFLMHEKHKFYPPKKIELYIDDVLKESKLKENLIIENGVAIYTINLNFSGTENVKLKFIQKELGKSSIACDEIQIF